METLNLEQRRSLEEVDQYRHWWQQYDRIMEVVTESSSLDIHSSPSLEFVTPTRMIILCVALLVTVLIYCRNGKRKEEEDLISRQSPPPPYSVVVQVKDDQDGLP